MAVNMTAIAVAMADWIAGGDGKVRGNDPLGLQGGGGGGDYYDLTPDYFVSSTGNDVNTGLSEGQAFLTLAYAYAQAVAGEIIGVVNELTENIDQADLEASPGTLGAHKTVVGKSLYTKINGHFMEAASTAVYFRWINLHFDGGSVTNGHKQLSPFQKSISCFFQCSGSAIVGNNKQHSSGTDQLYESCGFLGDAGRYNSYAYQKDRVLYRWCVGRTEQNVWTTDGNPTACFQIYSSTDSAVVGCVAVDCLRPDTGAEWLGAFVNTTNQGASTGIRHIQCIAKSGPGYGFHAEGNNGTNGQYDDCVSVLNAIGIGGDKSGNDIVVNGGQFSNNTDRGAAGINSGTCTISNANAVDNASNDFSSVVDAGGNTSVAYNMDAEISAMKRVGVTGTYWGETGWDVEQVEDAFPMINEVEMRAIFAASSTRGFCASGKTLTSYMKEQP